MRPVMVFFYYGMRLILFPLLRYILPMISLKAKNRLVFEQRNNNQRQIHSSAKCCFEVSSEGEFEQVAPIIDELVNLNHCIEIIYSSESVEHKIEALKQLYPSQIRTLRLPILTYNPFTELGNIEKWIQAPVLILTRYDFYPELILFGSKPSIKFYLTWAHIKRDKVSFWAKWTYQCFDKILAATYQDQKSLIEKFHLSPDKIENYDFRPWQVMKRLDRAQNTLKEKMLGFKKYNDLLSRYDLNKRVCFGSFYPEEVSLFRQESIDRFLEQGYCLHIFPHHLDDLSIKNCIQSFNHLKIKVGIWSHIYDDNSLSDYQVIIFDLKGILCEAYLNYQHSIVGGFYYSSHSLMEPFLAGSFVYHGEKTHRSTEYLLINEVYPQHLIKVQASEDILAIVMKNLKQLEDISSFKTHFKGHFHFMLKWLELDYA